MDAKRVSGVGVLVKDDVARAEMFEAVVYDNSHGQQASKKHTAFTRGVHVPEHEGLRSTTKDPASHRPDLPGTAINDRLCTGAAPGDDLPPGHTYRSYFWISHLARDQNVFGETECAKVKSRIIAELSLTEGAARRAFNQRFEYKFVDPGQGYLFKEEPINQISPVRGLGVFAKTPIEPMSFVGVFSGVMYSLTTKLSSLEADTSQLHAELKQQTPDMMTHHRMVSAIFSASAEGHLTPSIYTLVIPSVDGQHRLHLTPDNGRFTPMHFIGSTQRDEKANVNLLYTAIDTDHGLFPVPIIYSTRHINVGEQLSIKHKPSPYHNTVKPREVSAERERNTHQLELKYYVERVERINRLLPDQRISLYNDAPVFYLSNIVREGTRKSRRTVQARKKT